MFIELDMTGEKIGSIILVTSEKSDLSYETLQFDFADKNNNIVILSYYHIANLLYLMSDKMYLFI